MQSPEQDEDEFHNSFRLYLSSLEILAKAPEVQCELMGNHNVAWELKDEVCAGRLLVGRGHLTAEQEAWS